jgi:GT2 family glycosyltransferase
MSTSGSSNAPLLSVLILNYRGEDILEPCVLSVLRSSYPSVEIIIVDNSPSDGAFAAFSSRYQDECSRVSYYPQSKNVGFCDGFNLGIHYARGPYILLLNNDTEVAPDAFAKLIDFMESHPSVGLCEGRIVNFRSKFDGMVSNPVIVSWMGIFGHQGPPQLDRGQFAQTSEIFSATGVWPLVRASVLVRVGLFDADFVIAEEIRDLCWRIWLSGQKVMYFPRAVVKHVGRLATVTATYGVDTKAQNVYHEAKNSVLMLLKNLGLPRLFAVLPAFIVVRSVELIWLMFTGHSRSASRKLRGYEWIVANMSEIMDKRRHVQRDIRRVTDASAFSALARMNPISHFAQHLREDAFV